MDLVYDFINKNSNSDERYMTIYRDINKASPDNQIVQDFIIKDSESAKFPKPEFSKKGGAVDEITVFTL